MLAGGGIGLAVLDHRHPYTVKVGFGRSQYKARYEPVHWLLAHKPVAFLARNWLPSDVNESYTAGSVFSKKAQISNSEI